ncbi:xylulokinase [Nocardioides taihuensis]|uniref:FGGY-family carbohydrate kinase n=1 Tax=Nocardioides taihuensis TaxID=1835606 RepID=A0ABW0BN85_9ACTN
MSDDLVLAVDLGTGGPKVGLVTTRGEVRWWEHHAVRTSYGEEGAAWQDPHEWWRLVVDATRRGLARSGVSGDDVVAVGVTGQWASTVPVDADGLPVGDCVMWTDTRGARYSRAVVGGHLQGYAARPLATWVRHSAGIPTTSGADPVGHMLHLERDRPEVASRTRWYLEPVDHLTMRFTGVAAASPMSMTAAWLTDNRRLDLLAYDQQLVALAGVDVAKLPPLVRSGSVVAPVSAAAAAELGLPERAVVITGMPDLHGITLGSGAVLEGEGHVSIGTSGWISCPLRRKKTDLLRQIATVPGLGGGGYLMGNSQDSAGRCLQWWRDTFAPDASYDEVTALAATSPPGAGGVIFTPWLTGERSPVDDRAARAGFHNVALSTTRADLARAVLEGVALNTRWLLEAAEHFAGHRLDPFRLVGGGAQSDLWSQVVADVTDHVVERPAEPLLSGLRGVALAAGLALGEHRPSDIRGLVPVDRTFRPDPARRGTYDRLYHEFTRLHRAERGMFRRLNAAD